MEPFPLRVLVADEQGIAREDLVACLEQGGLEVVGSASDATEAVEVARRERPDVALVDVRLPGGAVYATRGIIGSAGGCSVLALSADAERGAILELLLAGAGGYLIKGTPSRELLAIVRRAARAQTDPSVDGVPGLIRDLLREIAELSEMHQRLRRSEEKFRSLLEAAPDAVVVVNRQGEIVLVNRQTEMIFGYARSELLGRPMEFLVPERFHADHIRRRLKYLADPQTRRMGSVPGLVGRRMNAAEFPVDISLSTLQTDEETLVIAFVRELPVRGGSVEEMSHARSMRGDNAHREVIDVTDAAHADPERDAIDVRGGVAGRATRTRSR